jgi:hypothetical protein
MYIKRKNPKKSPPQFFFLHEPIFVQVEGSTLFFSLSILIRVFIAFGESAMTPACYTLAAQQVGENHQVRRIIIFSGTSDLQEFCSKKLQFNFLSQHYKSSVFYLKI